MILIIFIVIYYVYRWKQRRQNINGNLEILPRFENKIMNSIEVIEIKPIEIQYISLYLNLKIRTGCIVNIDVCEGLTVEMNHPIDQIVTSVEEQTLICYCDGSYSYYMQIGCAGFRASNGASIIRPSFPRESRYGSTDAEVYAAYLAIQYALEKQYHALIIYTDNSKVEQLLKRPKEKDKINYSHIRQILYQFQKQNGDNAIEIIRVRGHTTISEQRTCKIKYEFAKIDRAVRRKTSKLIKRWPIQFYNHTGALRRYQINVGRGYYHLRRFSFQSLKE
jgi:ribonuclease HI